MRKQLSKNEGLRKRFSGIFTRIGKKKNFKGYSEDTILLTSIVDLETREKITDHLWFAFTKGFQDAGLREGKEGSAIEFDARVKEYVKGYVNRSAGVDKSRADWKLSNPTKIRIAGNQ
jgi:hypothetical protein